ncbi:FadR/GntR family transcriptional regulator [Cohnella sp. 56]|uniref:FadR/GntR family transcriptional regulator n=1 Tax=Cohnella sp. 56 TaxID=3113722 RepID=UPI0030E8FD8B
MSCTRSSSAEPDHEHEHPREARPIEAKRLTKRNHYEEIALQIRRQIEDGRLKPGDKLPSTREISEQFGVGRSTTREALSALKAMGLIDIRQGGGCRVAAAPPDPQRAAPEAAGPPELLSLRDGRKTLLELLEVRQTLEVSIASIAAAKRTAEDLAALRALLKEMEAGIGDDIEGERTDLEFHMLLARATRNEIMISLFASITGQMERAIRDIRRVELYASRSVARRLYEEHSAILEAVAEQEPLAASLRMNEHLAHVERMLLRHL